MPKTTMRIGEIKPAVQWNAADARNLLIKIGAALKKKAEKASQNIGAVKCTDRGNGQIEFEWTGNLDRLTVEELIRY